MIAATLNHDPQGAAQRRGGQPLRRWSAAPSVVDHKFQFPPRLASLGRGHCRGSGTPRTFFSIARRITAHRRLGCSSSRLSRRPQFTPVSIDPDKETDD